MRLRTAKLMAGIGAAVLMLAALPATGSAQQRTHFGLRAGYNFELEEPAVGAHFAIPMTSQLDFYPSLDAFLPASGTRLLFNGDVKYRFLTATTWEPYLGGGLNLLHRSVDGTGSSELGANLLGGIETRVGNVHPFFEGRVVVQDDASFQLTGGLNITLGRW